MGIPVRKAKPAKVSAAPAKAKKKSKLSFFPEAIAELRKAHWPTRQDTLRLSIIVLIICVALGLILGGFDYVFAKLAGFLVLGG